MCKKLRHCTRTKHLEGHIVCILLTQGFVCF